MKIGPWLRQLNEEANEVKEASEDTLKSEYREICRSHQAITDFRGKLLGLKYRIDLPPMKPTWTSELAAARRRVKEAAWKQEPRAALDQAEVEYLTSLYDTLINNRIPTAARDSQPGKRYRMRH